MKLNFPPRRTCDFSRIQNYIERPGTALYARVHLYGSRMERKEKLGRREEGCGATDKRREKEVGERVLGGKKNR